MPYPYENGVYLFKAWVYDEKDKFLGHVYARTYESCEKKISKKYKGCDICYQMDHGDTYAPEIAKKLLTTKTPEGDY